MIFDGIADEAVQALALTGGEILDDLPLALFDDDIDTVICLFVISGSSFFLRIIILWMLHKITSYLY